MEYNKLYCNFKNVKELSLSHPFIILSYGHYAETDANHGRNCLSAKQEVKYCLLKDGHVPILKMWVSLAPF